MKKSFIYAGAILAATISLTNCTKEINSSEAVLPEGIPFEICANPTTKTAVEGLSTKWAAGDGINVFHAAAGTKEYVSDNEFTIAGDLADGRFTGALSAALGEGTYDWYAFYPYSKYNKTPAGSSQDDFGFTTIGGTSQTQIGNNSTAHLCGTVCPLYGVAKSVASSATPGITMKHLTSIIEVNVTNNSGKDLSVSSVSFTGTEDIVGTYYINFTQTPVVYTSRGETYVSNTASLSVTGGETIADGASAKFYIAIKPFTAPDGSSLTLSVNGYKKKVTLTKDLEFTAGHIKTLGFEFDKVQTVFTWNLSVDSTSEATEEKIAWTGSWGEMTCIKASSSSATAANNYYPGTSGKNYTSTRFYKNSTLSITPAKSLTYYVFEATTADYASALASSEWTNATTDVDGTTVTIIADDPSEAVSAKIGGTCGFTKVDCHTDAAVFPPIISVSPSSLDIPSAGAVPTIRYSIKRPIDGGKIIAKSDKDWVNTFDYSVDGEISFVVNENTGDARSASITISYPDAEDVVVAVNQSKQSTGASVTIKKTISEIISENEYTVSTGSAVNSIVKTISLDTNISVTVTGTGNTGSFWGSSPKNDWRIYSKKGDEANVTINALNEKKILKMVIEFSTSNGGGLVYNSTTLTSGNSVDINSLSSVSMTVPYSSSKTGQARITSFEITYE